LIWSSAWTVRCSTVPPPSKRSESALFWLRITGTSPGSTVVFNSGFDGVPAVIWT
jgi:hypothetical protein